MQIFSADSTTFSNVYFVHKKLKKPSSKVAQKKLKSTLFLTAQMTQTEEFMFQNVAYRTTLYKTGVDTMKSEFLVNSI